MGLVIKHGLSCIQRHIAFIANAKKILLYQTTKTLF